MTSDVILLTDASEGSGKRAAPARSDISFPYAHLEEAVAVAKAIADNGTALSRDQIAAVLGVDSAGVFRLRMSAARTFKLIEPTAEGKYQPSDLGYRIISNDEDEARGARREAFLNVPLYQKTFEAFKGRALPPRPNGMENAFVSFGVAPKQKDKARLAFEKSAQFAGFFHAGRDRLVEPIVPTKAAPNPPALAPAIAEFHGSSSSTLDSTAVVSPARGEDASEEKLIRGMLDRLPPLGSPWPVADRARWLRRLAHNLAMVYAPDEDTEIEVKVTNLPPVTMQPKAAPQSSPAQVRPSAPSKAAQSGSSWEPSSDDLDDEIPF